MPPSLSTADRIYFLTLHDYGEDDLLIEEMTGREAMSQLFEFRLTLLSTRDGGVMSVTLLSSDMGKLYVALAQAIERLRQ